MRKNICIYQKFFVPLQPQRLIWEKFNNPNFNVVEFDHFRMHAGLNNFKISVKEFVERTGAICIQAKAGRYGGTYAHKA